MNLYNAIMLAADHIESHPKEFDWHSVSVPTARHCGTPGCAVGWVAHFLGVKFYEGAVALAGSDLKFYDRMGTITPHLEWSRSPAQCASTLRLYAEKYHGHEKPVPRNFARELMAKCERQTVSTQAVSEELTW